MKKHKEKFLKKIFASLPIIETERLILRPVRESDHKAVFEYASDPETAAFTVWKAHKHIEDSKTLVRFILKRYLMNKPSSWAVDLKKEGKMIGMCGFVSSFNANKRGEVAFVFNRKHWKRGYATEALGAAIKFGFKELRFNRIEASCDAENAASVRVLEKCGMKYEGVLRQYALTDRGFRDMKIYAVLAGDASA